MTCEDKRQGTSRIAFAAMLVLAIAGVCTFLLWRTLTPSHPSSDDGTVASTIQHDDSQPHGTDDTVRKDAEAKAQSQREDEARIKRDAAKQAKREQERVEQERAAKALRQHEEQDRQAKVQHEAEAAAETRLVQLVNQGIKDMQFPQRMFDLDIELVKAKANTVDSALAAGDKILAQSEVNEMKACTREMEDYRTQILTIQDRFRGAVRADPALVAAALRVFAQHSLSAEQQSFLISTLNLGSDGEQKTQDIVAGNNGAAVQSNRQPPNDIAAMPDNAQEITKSLLGYIAAGQVCAEHQRRYDDLERQGDRYLAAGDGASAEVKLKAALKENEACGQALEIQKSRLDELKRFQVREVYAVRDSLLNAPGLDAQVKAQLREFQLRDH